MALDNPGLFKQFLSQKSPATLATAPGRPAPEAVPGIARPPGQGRLAPLPGWPQPGWGAGPPDVDLKKHENTTSGMCQKCGRLIQNTTKQARCKVTHTHFFCFLSFLLVHDLVFCSLVLFAKT